MEFLSITCTRQLGSLLFYTLLRFLVNLINIYKLKLTDICIAKLSLNSISTDIKSISTEVEAELVSCQPATQPPKKVD